MHDVLRIDLENLYPWVSEETLSHATTLVTERLDKYEHVDTYNIERFNNARALSNELAALVGPAPELLGQAAPASGPLIIADALLRAATKLRDRVQHLRAFSPREHLRSSGEHDRRTTH